MRERRLGVDVDVFGERRVLILDMNRMEVIQNTVS